MRQIIKMKICEEVFFVKDFTQNYSSCFQYWINQSALKGTSCNVEGQREKRRVSQISIHALICQCKLYYFFFLLICEADGKRKYRHAIPFALWNNCQWTCTLLQLDCRFQMRKHEIAVGATPKLVNVYTIFFFRVEIGLFINDLLSIPHFL